MVVWSCLVSVSPLSVVECPNVLIPACGRMKTKSASPPTGGGGGGAPSLAGGAAAVMDDSAASGIQANQIIGKPLVVQPSTRRCVGRPPNAGFRYQPTLSLRIAHHSSVRSTNSAFTETFSGTN